MRPYLIILLVFLLGCYAEPVDIVDVPAAIVVAPADISVVVDDPPTYDENMRGKRNYRGMEGQVAMCEREPDSILCTSE